MQIIPWRLSTGEVEPLASGEVRTIPISVAPDTPTSATVEVRRRSTGAVEVAETAATVTGSIVSTILTVPAYPNEEMDVRFLVSIAAEVFGVIVRVPINTNTAR